MIALGRHDRQGLLTATRRLVDDVGGLDAAAAACRLARSALARHYAPQQAETMPIDVVAELERASGTAPVTTALARLAGHALVPLALEPGQPELLRRMGELMRRVGLACAAGAEAMADDVLTPAERAQLSEQLHQVVSEGSAIMAWLAQHEGHAG